MRIFFDEFTISTSSETELVDITREVEERVARSKIEGGMVLVFAPHATGAIVVNEHESGLMQDQINAIKRLVPRSAGYQHDRIDDNAHAHLKSAIIGTSRVFPLRDGSMIRGTWQNIFFLESDGPRSRRRIIVEVIGE